MSPPRIRNIAICVFHHQGKILVNAFPDPVKQQTLFRPLGGGIEFGERSADAIVREIREELNLPIRNVRLLGTLESLFTYLGSPAMKWFRSTTPNSSTLKFTNKTAWKGRRVPVKDSPPCGSTATG